jgi:acetylornithine/succinyldiaminopimelate/putrescine aminotransferase
MVLMTSKISECLKPGDHGTTFGGNPVACAAGLAAVEIISKPQFLKNVCKCSTELKAGLEKLAKKYSWLGNVRGEGLLLGIECEKPVADIITACRKQGLLILRAGTNVLRFLPPLIITKNDVKEALKKLNMALGTF